MHLSRVISQSASHLPPIPGLEGLPVVIRPVARLQREAGFFAVKEHLEEDFRLAGGAVEDELEVGAHGDVVGLAPIGDFVGGEVVVAHPVHVQDLHQGEDRVVVAEAEVGADAAFGDAVVGLGDDVVHDGLVALVRGPDLGVELEVVDLPELVRRTTDRRGNPTASPV